MSQKEIIFYQDSIGKEPFNDWLLKIRDKTIRRRILTRLLRVENGNYGDYKSLKDGIFELRFTFGGGFRVYFGEDGDRIVVLLLGGDKSTQTEDIEKAKNYWQEYLNYEKI
ncbi:type II toxin-antitoxin system RelE/ParE family toxin [Geminocystis sp. CENA526]|uniref:type II toxin-antitoxin system RelE/ParE family toxin n=1 Tax=Geminocystis sp. CENA526 TaxID=1355871 RepID=UPI003D6DB9D8